jgi:hypothetical protein
MTPAARTRPGALRVRTEQVEGGAVPIGSSSIPFGCVPFLIEGLVSRWPAYRDWSARSLASRLGERPVDCFVAEAGKTSFLQQANETLRTTFADFLASVFGAHEESDGERRLYLRIPAGDPLYEALAADFEIPAFLPGYNPDATGIWIGQKGNLTPFHHDWWHSCLAQVSGHKRYTLVHPLEAEKLQRGWPAPSRYDLAPAPPAAGRAAGLAGLETVIQGILEPGQLLYIPPYWFHEIETLDNGNISLPIRYDTGLDPGPRLFRLGQDAGLREITNQNVRDPDRLVETLRRNRRLFAAREREFVEAFVTSRETAATPGEILGRLDEEGEAR